MKSTSNKKTSDSRHNLDLFAVIQVPVLERSSFQWLVIFQSPKTSILQVVMSVVIFLPLFLTKVGNNNFWATMKQNKTKITKKEEEKKITTQKRNPNF